MVIAVSRIAIIIMRALIYSVNIYIFFSFLGLHVTHECRFVLMKYVLSLITN